VDALHLSEAHSSKFLKAAPLDGYVFGMLLVQLRIADGGANTRPPPRHDKSRHDKSP
jgi:hypothetical protein